MYVCVCVCVCACVCLKLSALRLMYGHAVLPFHSLSRADSRINTTVVNVAMQTEAAGCAASQYSMSYCLRLKLQRAVTSVAFIASLLLWGDLYTTQCRSTSVIILAVKCVVVELCHYEWQHVTWSGESVCPETSCLFILPQISNRLWANKERCMNQPVSRSFREMYINL